MEAGDRVTSSETKLPVASKDNILGIPRAIWMLIRRGPGSIAALLMETVDDWYKDNAPRLGAALAFYTLASLAPLLIVVVAIAGAVFGRQAAQGQLVYQIRDMVGHRGAEAIQAVLQSAQQPDTGGIATALGVLVLLFGATTAVTELRSALNQIWDVPQASGNSLAQGILDLLRERFFALILVMVVGSLLLMSLFVNTLVSTLGAVFSDALPVPEVVIQLVNFAVSFVVITVLFGAIYKFVPDVEISWEDVGVGAAFTSLLFSLGKIVIGLYLARSGLASPFGAAGSLVVLLLWVYYSAQVFFFGAEFTQAYANRYGSRMQMKRRVWQLPGRNPTTTSPPSQESGPLG